MVQMIPGNGVINLESTLGITPGQLARIKANTKKINEICRDLQVSHAFFTTEDGNIISKIGCTIDEKADAILVTNVLREKHRSLIRQVDKWDEPKKEEAEQPSDEQPSEEFFTIRKTENGYECDGNMDPKKVFAMLKAAIIFKMIEDEEQPE